MNSYLAYALEIIAATVILVIGYSYLKNHVFSKLKVNKWVVLAAGIVVFIIQTVLGNTWRGFNTYISLIFSIVFVILILWFFDLMGWTSKSRYEKRNKKDDIVIKPKAKPNRAKKDKK